MYAHVLLCRWSRRGLAAEGGGFDFPPLTHFLNKISPVGFRRVHISRRRRWTASGLGPPFPPPSSGGGVGVVLPSVFCILAKLRCVCSPAFHHSVRSSTFPLSPASLPTYTHTFTHREREELEACVRISVYAAISVHLVCVCARVYEGCPSKWCYQVGGWKPHTLRGSTSLVCSSPSPSQTSTTFRLDSCVCFCSLVPLPFFPPLLSRFSSFLLSPSSLCCHG